MWVFSFLIGPLLIQYLWVYFYFFIMSEDILEIEQKPTKKFYSKKKKKKWEGKKSTDFNYMYMMRSPMSKMCHSPVSHESHSKIHEFIHTCLVIHMHLMCR